MDRGATLVEYALGASLLLVVSLGSINFLQTRAKSDLTTRGNAIGTPDLSSGTTTTTTGSTSTTAATTTTTTGAYAGVVSGTCTGPNNDAHTCSFTLAPAPPTPATWSILPNSGFTGSAQAPVFTSIGIRSVRATVTGYPDFQKTVTCTTNGNSGNIDCVVS